MFKHIQQILAMANMRELALARHHCPRCNKVRFFIRLNKTDISVRCISCKSSAITLSLIDVLLDVTKSVEGKSVFELSARGPFVEFLRDSNAVLHCSEYFDDIEPGEYKNQIQCQDVQRLSFNNNEFDLCTSSEVFEHVPDDHKGFAEIFRVLNEKGICVFTVPLDLNQRTLERALLNPDGSIEHLEPEEYHLDPIRGNSPILAFRTYGIDIVERLVEAGFARAEIRTALHVLPWINPRPIVVAYKTCSTTDADQDNPRVIYQASSR